MIDGKKVLITGGTGSFGKTVLKRVLDTSFKEVRIFSRDEKKQEEMRLQLGDDRIKFYIGDVRDLSSIDAAMQGIDLVFHAAALKQVPSCEFYPMEAVKTNILGAENVIQSATRHGVDRCVVLSTDKAVQPVNAMGMSKALMEKIMISNSKSSAEKGTILCATRYGNVMASRGSVIPLFIKQILSDRPITITDPKMTRFLMSVEESVDLVFHAFKNAKPGDIFVQKSPASTIGDLADAIIDLIKPNHAKQIIGTRHGEKAFETLVSREELLRSDDMEKFYRIQSDTRDLNYNKYFSDGSTQLAAVKDYSSDNTKRLSVEEVKNTLMELPIVNHALRQIKK